MMSEEVIADLKHCITAAIAQQSAQLKQELQDELRPEFASIRREFSQEFKAVREEIADLSAAVADALQVSHDTHATWLRDHEARLLQLEHSKQ